MRLHKGIQNGYVAEIGDYGSKFTVKLYPDCLSLDSAIKKANFDLHNDPSVKALEEEGIDCGLVQIFKVEKGHSKCVWDFFNEGRIYV